MEYAMIYQCIQILIIFTIAQYSMNIFDYPSYSVIFYSNFFLLFFISIYYTIIMGLKNIRNDIFIIFYIGTRIYIYINNIRYIIFNHFLRYIIKNYNKILINNFKLRVRKSYCFPHSKRGL